VTHVPQRFVGIFVTCVVIFTMDLNQTTVLHTLLLPLLLALAGYLVTQSLMAVSLATAGLAFANMDLSSQFWVARFAYPGIAVLGFVTFLWLLIVRFRTRILTTREDRWANRTNPRE
jgi:hypothetical protein